MDEEIKIRPHKKDCGDGWRCPFCKGWIEFNLAGRHLREDHRADYAKALAEALVDNSFLLSLL